MKIKNLLVIFAVLSFNLVNAAGSHDTKPLHGGKVSVFKDIDIELVANSSQLKVFLRDHGKPIDIKQGSAKITLLEGGVSKDFQLLPKGTHFELSGAFAIPKGAKAIVVINMNNKVLTARYNLD